MTGVVAIRGIEKTVRVPVTQTRLAEGGDAWTAYAARWALDRRDFGISWRHSAIPFFVGEEVAVDLVFVSR